MRFGLAPLAPNLPQMFCGLVSADMPGTGTEGFLSNKADG